MNLTEVFNTSELTERERKAFLYREAGFTFSEISEFLGISTATAYRLDLKARKRMVKMIEKERALTRDK